MVASNGRGREGFEREGGIIVELSIGQKHRLSIRPPLRSLKLMHNGKRITKRSGMKFGASEIVCHAFGIDLLLHFSSIPLDKFSSKKKIQCSETVKLL